MKQTKIIAALSLLASCSITNAGTMGADSNLLKSSSTPYFSLEGSYTWNQLNEIQRNNTYLSDSDNGWGGRLAAGFIQPYIDHLSLTAEFGGGYYGQKRFVSATEGMNIKRTIDGYDLLVGALYSKNQFGIFGDIGVMLQNLRSSSWVDISKSAPGGLFSGISYIKANQTQVLPELKAGVIYGLYPNLSLSFSYLHVFGSNTYANSTKSGASTIAFNANTNIENPTIDTILLGFRYNFA